MPPKICKRVYDLYGKEVKASDILKNNIVLFNKGTIVTLRNNDYTFWAEVECVKTDGNRYWFRSVMYGWLFIVNLKNNTVMQQG